MASSLLFDLEVEEPVYCLLDEAGGAGGLGGGAGFKATPEGGFGLLSRVEGPMRAGSGSGFEPFLNGTFFILFLIWFNKLDPLNIFSIYKYTI